MNSQPIEFGFSHQGLQSPTVFPEKSTLKGIQAILNSALWRYQSDQYYEKIRPILQLATVLH